MIRYHISLLILVLVACVLQQFLPTVTSMFDARVYIFPLVFLCCAVTIDFAPMLLLAFICGFLWDAEHVLGPTGGDPEIYKHPAENLRFGYSILLYGMIGFLMQGFQPLFRKGVWQLSILLSGISILFYLTVEYLLINFIRGDFTFPGRIFTQIWISATLTMFVSPLIFGLLFKLAKLFNHTIRYDGLRKRYFSPDSVVSSQ